MNRSQRVAVTAAAASALIAGGAGAVLLGPLGSSGFATAPAPATAAPPVNGPAADPGRLHAAVSRLSGAATALQGEITAARHRLDAAGALQPGPAAIPRNASGTSSAARHVRRAAPAVHTRTGASSVTGSARKEAEDD